MRRLFLSLCVLLLSCLTTATAQPYCSVRNFSIRDGLAASMISRIEQTPNGIVWFATWNGLCYYDGYRFSTFRNTVKSGNVLSTNRLLNIKSNAEGDIWCVSYDLRLYLFQTQSGTFTDVSSVLRKKFHTDFLARSIVTLPNGHTWVLTPPESDILFSITDSTLDADGNGVRRYSKHALGLDGCNVSNVVLAPDGTEWLLTDKGLARLDKRVAVKHQCSLVQRMEEKLLFASTDGQLWYYGKGGNLRKVLLPAGVSHISCMKPYSINTLLIGTDKGILELNTDNMSCRLVDSGIKNVEELHVDRHKRVWAFTDNDGVEIVVPQTGQTVHLQSMGLLNATSSDKPFWIEDKFETVWTVPRNGVFSYYDEATGRLVPYILQSDDDLAFSMPYLTRFFVDAQGNLWLVGSRNLAMVNFKRHNINLCHTMRGLATRAMASTPDGRLLVGDQSGHLFVFDNGGRLAGYMDSGGHVVNTPVIFSKNGVYTMKLDSRYRLWIGTKGDGLYMLEQGRMSHFLHSAGDKWSLSHNDVYAIDEDNRGNIWIGTFERGVNLLQEGNHKFANIDNVMRQFPQKELNRVRRITHTPGGVVIVSCSNGIITFSNKFSSPSQIHPYLTRQVEGDTTSLQSGDVLQTVAMRSGHVYVATLGGGIQQVASGNLLANQLKFRRLPQFSEDEGNVQSMIEDQQGNLWVVRESTIDKYNPKTGHVSQYGPGDLDGRCDFTEAQPYYNPVSRQIVMGIVGGYIAFSPQQLLKQAIKPNIVFTTVLYQGEQTPQLIMGSKVLDLPSDRRNVTISFSAIDYTDNYLVKYAYMLEGVDKEWNYTDNNHSASLSNLPAGHYKLLVRSTNCDGEWVDNQRELSIYVHPTFWETIWAKLLYALIALTLIFIVLYIYYLHNRNKLDRQMNEIKMRFFTDMGHKLRTPLTLIGGPATEILNREPINETTRNGLEMIQRNSRSMLEMVNDMLDYNMEGKNYFVDDESAPVFVSGKQKNDDDETEKQDITLLVVEDNTDLRAFLSQILSSTYHVITAENGRKGLEMASKEQPDFIITDVMMPEMDGITMVHHLKQNNDTSHIPIIILSAKASLEDKLTGLKEGVDDYITKPFSATYLMQRVENIIGQRRLLQQQIMAELSSQAIQPDSKSQSSNLIPQATEYHLSSPQIVDADKKMMQEVMKYLEEHIGDEKLKIEDIASAVNLSYIVFLEKIKSIVGMTAKNFVQTMRMQRAEELIAKSKENFSQIAYAVGFTDPKYFGKCFRKATGMSPSEYRKKAQAEAD